MYGAAAEIVTLERQIEQQENFLSVLLGSSPGPIARGRAIADQTHLPDVPAGEYTIVGWHERIGEPTQKARKPGELPIQCRNERCAIDLGGEAHQVMGAAGFGSGGSSE